MSNRTNNDQSADRVAHPVDSTTRDCCQGIGRHTPDCTASSTDIVDRHGWHSIWCEGQHEPHSERWPYCERMIGGVNSAITEPDWNRAQVWVSVISAFLHGTFTAPYALAAERNRNGIQLDLLIDSGDGEDGGWESTRINIRSGDARTLAALLVAAADVSDGITRIDAREDR
ncbi:hypothetical protein [Mycobacterium malmoense]|uniref:hypothetical protein n=1 Tax=Mycobacterium malmoense TaxID=1780 RepID=UPI0009F6B97B|nr:hypothetical protein [Mycobacterium malmoense]